MLQWNFTLALSGCVVRCPDPFYIPQRGVQWKQGVVIYMTLYTSLLYNTTPIHCTPLPLHPPCNEYPSLQAEQAEGHVDWYNFAVALSSEHLRETGVDNTVSCSFSFSVVFLSTTLYDIIWLSRWHMVLHLLVLRELAKTRSLRFNADYYYDHHTYYYY